MSTRERFEKLQGYQFSSEPWDLESSADGNLLRRDQVLYLADEIDGDVARALAPREQSPELSDLLSILQASELDMRTRTLTPVECSRILSELDRRAAEIARLTAIIEMASAAPTKEPTT